MLNYSNLSDVAFEELCKDIMERKLNLKFKTFAKGKDKGIDLTDDTIKHTNVVQIKHYFGSTASQLISNLKKEVDKVKELNPEHYYICCSLQLTPDKVATIRKIFDNYIDKDSNILDIKEIDSFLMKEENFDIVEKHFSLWLDATGIIEKIKNEPCYIDCKVLVSNIEKEQKYYVKTSSYYYAIQTLSKDNVLMIVGNPGVGKTTTCKMLTFYYLSKGYKTIFSTDVNSVKDIKSILSKDHNKKEIIFIDDCLGQAYFSMKETQSSELLSLIRYVKSFKNKKLILNSRITILKEAKRKNIEFSNSLDDCEFITQILDMNKITSLDKAKILYNYMYFNVKKEYFDKIKSNKNYIKIIEHKNYNPRIIEFICYPNRYNTIVPNKYCNWIIENLNNPERVWDDEYDNRLSKVDRILLTTVYSFSDMSVDYDKIKDAFNYRISFEYDIDKTQKQFEMSLERLMDGLLQIIDSGVKAIKVANPSINDYLDSRLKNNKCERNLLLSHACSILQYNRLIEDEKEFNSIVKCKIKDHSILDLIDNKEILALIITYYISDYNIKDDFYKDIVEYHITNGIDNLGIYSSIDLFMDDAVLWAEKKEIIDYYDIDKIILRENVLKNYLQMLDLENIVFVVNNLKKNIDVQTFNKLTDQILDGILDGIFNYCEQYCIDDMPLDDELRGIISECTYGVEYGYEFDSDTACRNFSLIIDDYLYDKIYEILINLPEYIRINVIININSLSNYVGNIKEYIDKYNYNLYYDYDSDSDDYLYYSGKVQKKENIIIDNMFNR